MPDKAKMNALENLLISRAKQSNCQSYVEFLAHQDLIQSYLAKGFNVTTIWKALYEEGLITFKYSTFSKYLRQAKNDRKNSTSCSVAEEDNDNLHPIETAKPMEASIQEAQPQTATKLNLPDGMSHNPMINPKDLI
jgi:Family of unknown function (DUF5338)